MEKILNKRKIREAVKYLVQRKGFITEYDIQKRKKNLENIKKIVVEFERRLSVEVKR